MAQLCATTGACRLCGYSRGQPTSPLGPLLLPHKAEILRCRRYIWTSPTDHPSSLSERIPLPRKAVPHSSGDSSVKLLKYADDTTLIGLIRVGDETAYKQKVERLVHWCSQNHLDLHPLKTVEMAVDFKRDRSPLPPLTILSNAIATTDTFKFLRSTISQDLKWTSHIDSDRKKAQQRLYFLRQLRKFNLPQELVETF
ncbi:F-box/WD repeat-containing protein 2 isoform X4 [Syngnathus typhle]|uniref:F-box/WD repeat-containing protein 2 isoform X4 n=1 Tax=Syngnathus typhle TaxID=161592 RepID=UPI002A6AF52E|nr:F-box/WD repeat-containing protein 2 isoform X4 [Syngnathus typhle]